MGITKILIIALFIWIALKVYSSLKLRVKKLDRGVSNKKIIPCSFCNTHIPKVSAIKVNNKYFCSLEHSKNA